MLVQPQQAATVCELDPVQHTIGSSKRAQTLDSNQPPENSYDPLNLTLDLEYAHVSWPGYGCKTSRPRHSACGSTSGSSALVGECARRSSSPWRVSSLSPYGGTRPPASS